MGETVAKPDIYFEAYAEYGKLVQQAEQYLQENFQDPVRLKNSERTIMRALRSEYRRLLFLRIFKTNIEHETLKLIRFFFLRERREDVPLRNYSRYLKAFMKKNRIKMTKPWIPPQGISLDEVITEMVTRILTPWDDPNPVLTEWIPQKIRESTEIIPADILGKGGIGKVFRVIAGVLLYAITDLESDTPVEEAKQRTRLALKSGYYFGLLHPLVDDLLDSGNHLSQDDKMEVLRLMDYWIGGDFNMPNSLEHHKSVCALKQTLMELFELFPPEKRNEYIKLSYFLHFSQMQDLQKIPGCDYSVSDIYVPVLLKAACTRLISCWFSGTKLTQALSDEILETGLVLQLMDDFRDIVIDLDERSFTPFTHFFLCKSEKPANPWLIYLHAIALFIDRSPNRPVSRRALLRRVAISIQNFLPEDNQKRSLLYLDDLFSESPDSNTNVRKILKIKRKIVDPDKSLFEPIDLYFKTLRH